jgi:hypothetical protein
LVFVGLSVDANSHMLSDVSQRLTSPQFPAKGRELKRQAGQSTTAVGLHALVS